MRVKLFQVAKPSLFDFLQKTLKTKNWELLKKKEAVVKLDGSLPADAALTKSKWTHLFRESAGSVFRNENLTKLVSAFLDIFEFFFVNIAPIFWGCRECRCLFIYLFIYYLFIYFVISSSFSFFPLPFSILSMFWAWQVTVVKEK